MPSSHLAPALQRPTTLVLLKLGGSLITEKSRPSTARPQLIHRIAAEIAAARKQNPALQLVLGHGSGSFGHVPAKTHGTRDGVSTPEQWHGFTEVWRQAGALNRIVVEALHNAGLVPISLPASASVTAADGQVASWDLYPLKAALAAGLLPVVYGDTVFDHHRGGTILSTEDLFAHLARQLQPKRILLAGLEAGVWADYPACTQLVPEITPDNIQQVSPALGGSASTDVTGGMTSKVLQMLDLAKVIPGLQISIFSGEPQDATLQALLGEPMGTLIHAEDTQQ